VQGVCFELLLRGPVHLLFGCIGLLHFHNTADHEYCTGPLMNVGFCLLFWTMNPSEIKMLSCGMPELRLVLFQVEQAIVDFSEGLRLYGIQPGDRVGLFSDNSNRWIIADQGPIPALYLVVAVDLSLCTTESKGGGLSLCTLEFKGDNLAQLRKCLSMTPFLLMSLSAMSVS
jgi:hypothetical protein